MLAAVTNGLQVPLIAYITVWCGLGGFPGSGGRATYGSFVPSVVGSEELP